MPAEESNPMQPLCDGGSPKVLHVKKNVEDSQVGIGLNTLHTGQKVKHVSIRGMHKKQRTLWKQK